MTKKKTTRMVKKAAPTNHFESEKYNSFSTAQKVVFWIGILSFAGLLYWIVRLIIYLTMQNRPKQERLNAYAMQTYVFGWIGICTLILLFIILTLGLALLIPFSRMMH